MLLYLTNDATSYSKGDPALEILSKVWREQIRTRDPCKTWSFEIWAAGAQLLHEPDYSKGEQMVQDSSICHSSITSLQERYV